MFPSYPANNMIDRRSGYSKGSRELRLTNAFTMKTSDLQNLLCGERRFTRCLATRGDDSHQGRSRLTLKRPSLSVSVSHVIGIGSLPQVPEADAHDTIDLVGSLVAVVPAARAVVASVKSHKAILKWPAQAK